MYSFVLQYINGLSSNLEVTTILQTAESIYKQLAEMEQLPDELRSLLNLPFSS